MARNKRLHVEMTMIKLTFLQQAIELSFDNQSATLVKKKRVSGPIAVKFEQLQSLQIKVAPAGTATAIGAKLFIEPKLPVHSPVTKPEKAAVVQMVPAHTDRLATEVAADTLETVVATLPVKPKEPQTAKKSLLQTLRDKHITNKTTEDIKHAVPVTEENLKEHWACFTDKLKKQLKHSVVTVFNNAELKVVNEHHFTVNVSASLEQKFIEQEKISLLEYLKDCFQNRYIGFTIHINEQQKDIVVTEATLTTREKYQKMVEQFPMIKELKDRLKLELDY
jgi:DNA polymerase-3 subunit gamma/tau